MINEALKLIRSGHPIAIPTETVYGLAADIEQPAAIEKIFAIKERPYFDPLIVHVSSINEVTKVAAEFPPLAKKLAENFWPGPLTIILPKQAKLNPLITSGLNTVGIRCPNHPIALELLQKLGRPLAAPSANKFGKTSPTTAEHVRTEFNNEVFILDGGPCSIGIESTVISFSDDYKKIYIVRPGAITQTMLRQFAVVEFRKDSAAPGQLDHHYMPNLPLVVLKSDSLLTESSYEHIQTRLGVNKLYPSWVDLSLSNGPALCARQLYQALRDASKKNGANALIINFCLQKSAGPYKADELWSSIEDRLDKASSLIL